VSLKVVVKSDTTSATTCGCIHWTYIFYSLEQAPGTEAHFSSEAALSTWWYPQQYVVDRCTMIRSFEPVAGGKLTPQLQVEVPVLDQSTRTGRCRIRHRRSFRQAQRWRGAALAWGFSITIQSGMSIKNPTRFCDGDRPGPFQVGIWVVAYDTATRTAIMMSEDTRSWWVRGLSLARIGPQVKLKPEPEGPSHWHGGCGVVEIELDCQSRWRTSSSGVLD
jgi:hypothetical protein